MSSTPTMRLRAMPAVALQALERMSDPELGVTDLADILRNDPAIVARLLAVANSAACGLQVRVTDVQQVVTLLGKPAVVSIVMSIALAPPNDILECDRPHYRRYWNEAVTMATSSEQLAKSVPALTSAGANPAEFFTAGLLTDVGRLAFLESTDFRYGDVLEEAVIRCEFPREVEARSLGTTHVAASNILLNSWNAPDFVVDAVNQHHCSLDEVVEQPGVSRRGLIDALIFSAAMVDYLSGNAKAELLQRLYGIGAQAMGLTEQEVETHIETVLDRMAETADLFTILPTDVEQLRTRFIAGLETAALVATAQHTQAQSAENLQRTNKELSERLEAITVRASRDGLTGAFNREYFEACLAQHLANGESDLGLVFIDIDNFKQVNDSYGHVAGDHVLKGVVSIIQSMIRSADLLARFGGDEFVILMPEGSAMGLQHVSKRVQQAVADNVFMHDGVSFPATISIGGALAYVDSLPDSVEEFLALADTAMYEAKVAGKNRVHISETPRTKPSMREKIFSRRPERDRKQEAAGT